MKNTENTVLSYLLNAFFDNLNNSKIKYCVLRNYEQLPYYTSNDVDIWCEDISKVEGILDHISNKLGYEILMSKKIGTILNKWYIIKLKDTYEIVHIDLIANIQWRGHELLSNIFLSSNLQSFNNFYIPNEGMQGIVNLLSGLFTRKEVKEKYREQVHLCYQKYPHEFRNICEKIFSKKSTDILLKCIGNQEWEKIRALVSVLKKELTIKKFIYNPLQLSYSIQYVLSFIYILLKPSGIHIAFCGIDGAGKSTIIERTKNIMRFVPTIRSSWWFGGALPRLSDYFSKQNADSVERIDKKYQRNVQNIYKMYIRVIYYYFDYLGAYFQYRYTKAWSGLVLSDRYYYDFLVDLKMHKIGVPNWLINAFIKITPSPDILFYLKIPPEIAYERKKEDSIEYLKDQALTWEQILPKLKKHVVIETLNTIEYNQDIVCKHVYRALKKINA